MAKYYPEVRTLILEAIEVVKGRSGSIRNSDRSVARQLGVSASAFSAWKLGQRAPSPSHAQMLATRLHPENDADREDFLARLLEAAGSNEATTVDPLDAVLQARRPIRVAYVDQGRDGFFGGYFYLVFNRFLRFAGLTCEWVPLGEGRGAEKGTLDADVAIDFVGTPRRSVRHKFFHTSFRTTVNAVYMPSRGVDADRVGPLLGLQGTPTTNRLVSNLPFELAYHPDELGGYYLERVLSLQPALGVHRVPYFSIDGYVQALLNSTTPVVVVAEESFCFEVASRLLEQGEDAALAEARFDSRPKPALRFPLGLAVHRLHDDWVDFIFDAFSMYLLNDAPFCATELARLHGYFEDRFGGLLERMGVPEGRRSGSFWARWAIGLDEGESRRLHIPGWDPIRNMARKMVESSKANEQQL